MIRYDENGLCLKCRLPGQGFVSDGVCECADLEEYNLNKCVDKIKEAESELGSLTKGQCRDLLKDNFAISHSEACGIVDWYKGEEHHV